MSNSLGPQVLIRQAADYECGKMPSPKTPQSILLKFDLNFFHVRVVLPPIMVLVQCLVSENGRKNKVEK